MHILFIWIGAAHQIDCNDTNIACIDRWMTSEQCAIISYSVINSNNTWSQYRQFSNAHFGESYFLRIHWFGVRSIESIHRNMHFFFDNEFVCLLFGFGQISALFSKSVSYTTSDHLWCTGRYYILHTPLCFLFNVGVICDWIECDWNNILFSFSKL